MSAQRTIIVRAVVIQNTHISWCARTAHLLARHADYTPVYTSNGFALVKCETEAVYTSNGFALVKCETEAVHIKWFRPHEV